MQKGSLEEGASYPPKNLGFGALLCFWFAGNSGRGTNFKGTPPSTFNFLQPMNNSYLESAFKQFAYYKMLGDKTFEQLTPEQLRWQPNGESNSIAIIVKAPVG